MVPDHRGNGSMTLTLDKGSHGRCLRSGMAVSRMRFGRALWGQHGGWLKEARLNARDSCNSQEPGKKRIEKAGFWKSG